MTEAVRNSPTNPPRAGSLNSLEALTDHLDAHGWNWKVKSYFDDGGHRSYCGVVYRPEWPRGYGVRKQYGSTAYEALRDALSHGQSKREELQSGRRK